MSLRIWLPLNGTLNNQGLDQITVTNNGATIDNNGKIGKCYSFDGNTSGININGDIISTLAQGDFSISFWVYNDDQGNRSIYIATIPSSSYAFAIQKTTGEGLRVYWQSSPDYYPTNFTVPVQEWCHITVVIKSNNCYCYKNGILTASREDGSFTPQKLTNTWLYGMLGRDLRTGATVLKGKLNDFRWYDHALSPLEVKQISQGLILHYPLNRGGWGQENLGNFASVASNWVMENLSGSNYTDSFYGNVIKLVTSSTNQRMYNYVPASMWQSGKVYTVSFLAKADTNGRTCDMSRSIADFSSTFTLTTNWKRYSGKITSTATPNGGTLSFRIHQSGATVYITQIKVEEGELATSYCPHYNESLYTIIGLNSTTEYDTSGFRNNGTRTGMFSWTSDTPKYSVSTAFEKGIISIPNSFVTTVDPIFSISLWFKLKSGITYTAYTDLISFSSSSYSNQPFRLELCGTPVGKSIMWFRGPSGQSGGFAVKSDISTDEWYHTVLVSEGNKQYSYYINGEKLGTYNGSANSWTPTGNVSLGENINGVFYESDVRIYATALSADDVKSLYNNSAYIDNQGNIYGAVYEEV